MRKISILLSSLGLALALSACGGQDHGGRLTESENRFWGVTTLRCSGENQDLALHPTIRLDGTTIHFIDRNNCRWSYAAEWQDVQEDQTGVRIVRSQVAIDENGLPIETRSQVTNQYLVVRAGSTPAQHNGCRFSGNLPSRISQDLRYRAAARTPTVVMLQAGSAIDPLFCRGTEATNSIVRFTNPNPPADDESGAAGAPAAPATPTGT